jgi:uncharacterized YccA/Bax inhibitor family protein
MINNNNNNNRSFFKKNNFIIEEIKNSRTFSGSPKQTCSFRSISIKTVFLFLFTLMSSLCSFSCLVYLIKNINSQETLSKTMFFIKTTLLFCVVLQFILIIYSNFLSLKYQKIISIMFSSLEGITLGFLLAFLKIQYSNFSEGIILAVLSTIMLFITVHFLYFNGLIKVDNRLRIFTMISFLILAIIQTFMHFMNMTTNYYSNPLFLLISICFLILGCITLATDFDDANFIVSQKVHKDNEWKVALGFNLNLIFIFIQCIRILLALGFFKEKNN